MQLSDRLMKVAEFVTEGYRVADIGTDHGYIPIWLIENNICPSGIAMDIGEGPLMRAKEHIETYGYSDRIETRLSDGLQKLEQDEADSVVIAGMGGALIVNILKNGNEQLKSVKELILSPHTESFLVRKYLVENEYDIEREEMVCDMGKYYTVMKAVKVKVPVKAEYDKSRYSYIYGKKLIEEKSEVFIRYLKSEKNKAKDILDRIYHKEELSEKREELLDKVKFIDEILS